MWRLLLTLVATHCLFNVAEAQSNSTTNAEDVNIRWLGSTPGYSSGTTFGLPWSQGRHYPNTTRFSISGGSPLQSWVTAYWRDGSIKWTGHALPASEMVPDSYTVTASREVDEATQDPAVTVSSDEEEIKVDTGKISVVFPKTGHTLIRSIVTAAGKVVGQNGHLVLQSQSGLPDEQDERGPGSIVYNDYHSNIESVTVSNSSGVRTVVTVRGMHQVLHSGTHVDWLPFILRFYLYAQSDAIRLIHTLVYDGKSDRDFITGIGVRFQVPLHGEELYNRHVRIAGVGPGVLGEAVQGLTGLRRDPAQSVRAAQINGEATPPVATWDERVSRRLQWIPTWNDFSLSQLSPDGFTVKKRTKAGQSWVKIPGSTRSGGLIYLGGAEKGGLAVGLRDFWKHYPTGLDVRNATTDAGEITVWVYSPEAGPLDLRPYHDGLGQKDYEDELDALEITYEDWEEGFNTPYGIARTNELYIYAFDETPSQDRLSTLVEHTNNPPVLYGEPEYISETKAIGDWWAPPSKSGGLADRIEQNLDFLVKFYQDQVEQRRWYGVFDYGDIMHTYDADRHQWRYDIGGYAWDNSELSPDLFFWPYFLRTGREDVYRFSEALTRHGGEVDVYHLGKWKGLGTRHGVQHWGDSAKQARISTAQYRKIFYFISGGDERVGEVIDETLETDRTYESLDPNRKVRTDGWTPAPGQPATIGLGTDWSALAASWLLDWERRGPRWEESRNKLTNTLMGIANLTNGFVTGSGLYNRTDGTLGPPPTDPENSGVVAVSHLSAAFGLMEVVAELTEHYGDSLPDGFEPAWLDYCYYYRAPAAEQTARYGANWTSMATLRQDHSRLLAYAAHRTGNASWATRAWKEFEADGLPTTGRVWAVEPVDAVRVLAPVEEAPFVSTNEAANYGLAAMVNLAYIGDQIPEMRVVREVR